MICRSSGSGHCMYSSYIQLRIAWTTLALCLCRVPFPIWNIEQPFRSLMPFPSMPRKHKSIMSCCSTGDCFLVQLWKTGWSLINPTINQNRMTHLVFILEPHLVQPAGGHFIQILCETIPCNAVTIAVTCSCQAPKCLFNLKAALGSLLKQDVKDVKGAFP